MSYFRNVPSLEERASLEVALNLCQEESFKAAALRLERPTYGFFYLDGESPLFVNNPKKLLKLNEKKLNASNNSAKLFRLFKDTDLDIFENHQKPPFVNDPRILSLWEKSGRGVTILNCLNDDHGVGRWYFAIEQQCQELTKNLPHSLKLKVCVWLHRIALEYASYCRRQEVLFGVSRYFLMNFLTRNDWTEACRLDEKKLAERLLKDEQLTVSQRYRIACVYCMLDDIPQLWKRLTTNEKNNMYKNAELTMSEETNHLIQIWSLDMDEDQDKVTAGENKVWSDVVRQLVIYGNAALLMPLWKKLEDRVRQNIIIDLALLSAKQWHAVEPDQKSKWFGVWRKKLLSNEVFSMRDCSVSCFNLQSYYSELILFFLLEMNEDQKLMFFQKSFEIEQFNILECFLDWPIRDYFLKTINQLWGIVPMDKYSHCLMTLASFCSASYHNTLQFDFSENYRTYYFFLNEDYKLAEGFFWYQYYYHYCNSLYKKENQYYDYQSLLWRLWEETPEIYKQGLFYDQNMEPFFVVKDRIRSAFFTELLKRSPFQVNDEALFKLIFSDLPQTDRAPMIRSEIGEEICSILLEKENYSLVSWLLHQCLKEDEIPSYKRQFMHSKNGLKLCFYKLQENHESSLSDLLDWSFDLDSEKTQFKHKLFDEKSCSFECELLLRRGEFAEVERIMNYCLLSDERRRVFKARCAEPTCDTLLANNQFELLDKVVTWCLNTEDDIKNFKKDFFTRVGLKTHYRLVFLEKWKEAKCFYEWFDLSPAEKRRLKNRTIAKNFRSLERGLFHDKNVMNFFVAPLRWCLNSKKAVIRFEHQVRRKCFCSFQGIFSFFNEDNKLEIAEERLEYLVKELSKHRKDSHYESFAESVMRVLSVLTNKGKNRSLKKSATSSKKRHLRRL